MTTESEAATTPVSAPTVTRVDDPIDGPKFYAEGVGPRVDWTLDLLQQADGRVLTWENGRIGLNCENGSWVFVETGRTDLGHGAVIVHSRWPD